MSFFAASEFYCNDGCIEGRKDGDPRLRLKLERTRELFGKPIVINSGWRCQKANAAAGGETTSAHLTGEAADLACSDSRSRALLLGAALVAGFRRIGIAKTFIHVDVSETLDNDVVWLYG